MVFSSLNFLFLFFLALLLCYFILPMRCREWRNLVLLAFSLFFYGYAGFRFLPLMLASILINYMFGLLVCVKKARMRKAFVIGSVVCNLSLLCWFKYAVFAAGVLNDLGLSVPIPQVVLPIGISFFTFQGMSYVLDVYRGDAQPERNILRVALYIALFPQLVAGPIVRYTTVVGEIRVRRETVDDFADGATRFLFGLAKKMLLANPLGQIADAAFATSLPQLSTGMAWLGVVAYTGQIYFDFSGYSDMAIGLGRIFGFHFLENFNYPYVSQSITEFWRRWHISLSSWFRDYVYIPLGGNRCSRWKQVRNVLIVWALTGFWHGAAWTFLLWGLYYGVLLLCERYLWGKGLEKLPAFLRHIYALFFAMLGWLLFRADSVSYAWGMLKILFGFGGSGLAGQATYWLLEFRWELLAAVVCALPVKVWTEDFLSRHQDKTWAAVLSTWGPKVLALGLGFGSLLALVSSTYNPFIYFRF
jgi:alginate O-acetyltransferase complex protein AlgI